MLYKGFALGLSKSRCMDEMEEMLMSAVLENSRAVYGVPVTQVYRHAYGYTDGESGR